MYSSIPEITQSRYILENPLLKIDPKFKTFTIPNAVLTEFAVKKI